MIDFDQDPIHLHFFSWTVPSQLRSLEFLVGCDDSAALLATLIRQSAPTLRHIGFILESAHIDVQDAFGPVASTLSSLRYVADFARWDDRDLGAIPPLLASLTNLEHIEVPVLVSAEAGLADALRGRERMPRLVLTNPAPLGTDCTFPSVVAEVLGGLGVQDLALSAAWLEELDDLGEGGADLSVEELAARKGEWEGKLEGLAPRFEWV